MSVVLIVLGQISRVDEFLNIIFMRCCLVCLLGFVIEKTKSNLKIRKERLDHLRAPWPTVAQILSLMA